MSKHSGTRDLPQICLCRCRKAKSSLLGELHGHCWSWAGDHIGHTYADHWLLQPEPGLSDGESSSGSTQSLKDLIYFTAKSKQHKSCLRAELSGSLGGKVQQGGARGHKGATLLLD